MPGTPADYAREEGATGRLGPPVPAPSGRTGARTGAGPSSTSARSTTRTAGSRVWTPSRAPSPAWTRQRDEAWLAGPGIAWWGGASSVGWLPDGRFWFHSERTGWSHLYAVDREGTVEPLTSGAFEVETAHLAADGQTWILQTSEGDLGQRHVWRMPVAPPGQAAQAFARREQLTDAVGRWDAAVSAGRRAPRAAPLDRQPAARGVRDGRRRRAGPGDGVDDGGLAGVPVA